MAKIKVGAHLQILAKLKFFQHKNPGKLQGTAFYSVGKKGKGIHRFSGSSSLGQGC